MINCKNDAHSRHIIFFNIVCSLVLIACLSDSLIQIWSFSLEMSLALLDMILNSQVSRLYTRKFNCSSSHKSVKLYFELRPILRFTVDLMETIPFSTWWNSNSYLYYMKYTIYLFILFHKIDLSMCHSPFLSQVFI